MHVASFIEKLNPSQWYMYISQAYYGPSTVFSDAGNPIELYSRDYGSGERVAGGSFTHTHTES